MTTQLAFHKTNFKVISRDSQIWLSAPQIASALQYSDQSSVNRIYGRHADEFTEGMTASVKLTDPNGDRQETRIFSLRGAHLIAMFARTPVAKEFRKWVLDILDKEVGNPKAVIVSEEECRYHARVIIYDNLFGGIVEFFGKANSLRNIASGISTDLGFKPTSFIEVVMRKEKLKRIQ